MKIKTESGVVYEDMGDAMRVTVGGAAWENLKKIACAMNRVEWCGDDNTPASVLQLYCGQFVEDAGHTPTHGKRFYGTGIFDVVEGIVNGIDTLTEDEALEKSRRRELDAALSRALGI